MAASLCCNGHSRPVVINLAAAAAAAAAATRDDGILQIHALTAGSTEDP